MIWILMCSFKKRSYLKCGQFKSLSRLMNNSTVWCIDPAWKAYTFVTHIENQFIWTCLATCRFIIYILFGLVFTCKAKFNS